MTSVMFVMPGSPTGNNMIFARTTAALLRDRGIQVVEFFISSRTNPVAVAREWWRLRAAVRENQPDIIHAQYGSVNGLIAIAAAAGCRKIMNVRGSDLNRMRSTGLIRNRLARLMTRIVGLRCDAVICVSADLKRQLWGRREKSCVIPSGVDTRVFFPIERSSARRELNIQESVPVVLFNAGKSPILKGMPLVEAALDIVRQRVADVRLITMTGGWSHREVALMMNAADCLVLASEAEGSPNVVREAMACNLPVVSVAAGDVPLRLIGVTPGSVVGRGAAQIAAGILEVLSVRMRSNGANMLRRRHLTVDDTVFALQEVYRRVMARSDS